MMDNGGILQEAKSLVKKIKLRHEHLKGVREPYEPLWKDCIDVSRPGLSSFEGTGDKGAKQGLEIWDGTVVSALRIMADGFQGYMCSPSNPWRKSILPNRNLMRDSEIRKWLDEVDEQLGYAYRRSNFYSATGPVLRHEFSVGTAVGLMHEDVGEQNTAFIIPHPRENYLIEDIFGRVIGVHREFPLTAFQAVDHWGKENLSDALIKSFEGDDQKTEYLFIEAIYRNNDAILKGENTKRSWTQIYIQKDHERPDEQKPLTFESFDSKPFFAWRYEKNSDEIYGRSPTANAIVDALGLQQMSKSLSKSAQLLAEPPVWAPYSLRGKVNLTPGGRTYYSNPGEEIKEIYTKVNYPVGLDWREHIKAAVEEHFFIQFFLMMNRAEGEQKVIQVMEKIGEKAALMGPRIKRMEEEFLVPVDDWMFEIEYRAGRLPPAPQRLFDESEGVLGVEFIGLLAQAEKRVQVTRNIQNAVVAVSPILQISPDSADVIDGDAATRRILRDNYMYEETIRSEQEVAQIRKSRLEQQQAAKAAEAAPKIAKSIAALQKASEPGSPLEAVTKGGA